MKKNTTKTEEVAPIVKVPKEKKVKTPSFELISYTMKATIPVGQYANICPEVTVKAVSIEAAERAVMPYIETLFAKYRDSGMRNTIIDPHAITRGMAKTETIGVDMAKPGAERIVETITDQKGDPVSAIVMTVPFNRAKGAIDSCTSIEALELVASQIEKSTKLIDTEKLELLQMVMAKRKQLNGTK